MTGATANTTINYDVIANAIAHAVVTPELKHEVKSLLMQEQIMLSRRC